MRTTSTERIVFGSFLFIKRELLYQFDVIQNIEKLKKTYNQIGR